VIAGLCLEVYERALFWVLDYYATSNGNFFTDVSGKPIGPILMFYLENGTDSLSRNVGKELPLLVA